MHNSFKQFRKIRKKRNWTVVSEILEIASFKYPNQFSNFQFENKKQIDYISQSLRNEIEVTFCYIH